MNFSSIMTAGPDEIISMAARRNSVRQQKKDLSANLYASKLHHTAHKEAPHFKVRPTRASLLRQRDTQASSSSSLPTNVRGDYGGQANRTYQQRARSNDDFGVVDDYSDDMSDSFGKDSGRSTDQNWQQMEPRGETPPKKKDRTPRGVGRNTQRNRQLQQKKQKQTLSGNEGEDQKEPSGNMQLLPGWDAATDNKSGLTYYFNTSSGERTWDWRKVIAAPPAQHSMYTSRRSARAENKEKSKKNYTLNNNSTLPVQPKRPEKVVDGPKDSPRARRLANGRK